MNKLLQSSCILLNKILRCTMKEQNEERDQGALKFSFNRLLMNYMHVKIIYFISSSYLLSCSSSCVKTTTRSGIKCLRHVTESLVHTMIIL